MSWLIALKQARRNTGAGFTAIEMVMTIGFMSMAAGLAVPMVREYRMHADIEIASQHIVQAIRSAVLLSQSGKFDAAWGVYVPDGVLFAGDSYALRSDEHDSVFVIPRSIEIHGPTELTFARITGLPNRPAEFCVESVASNGHRTLSMDRYGLVTAGPVTDGACDGDATGTLLASNGNGLPLTESSAQETEEISADNADSSVEEGESVNLTDDDSVSEVTDSQLPQDADVTNDNEGEAYPTTVDADDTSTGTDSSEGGGTETGDTEPVDPMADVSGDTGDELIPQDGAETGAGTVPCYIRHVLDQDSGTLMTVGTNDITVRVLTAEGTYGTGGPAISVRGSVSLDNGASWSAIGNGALLSGGEEMSLTNVAQGTALTLKMQGRYSWLFNKTVRSDEGNGRMIVLQSGDPLPSYDAFTNRVTLPVALRALIDDAGRVILEPRSLLFLTEFDLLDKRTADFRDAIVLVTFAEKAGTCTDEANPTVSISFNRLTNMGTGDATRMLFAGPDALPFTEDQSIPLIDDNGSVIVDGGLRRDVPGLALERGDGWLRILSRGTHANSSGKEIIDAVIHMENASITEIQNDTGADAVEFPDDGLSDDTSSGDEVVPAADHRSVLFKTRVIADNDAIYIRWVPDAMLAATDTLNAAAPEAPDAATIDPCAVPFEVGATGMLTLASEADITIRILGVNAVVGGEGSPGLLVRGRLSTDGGVHFDSLWDNRVLTGNETAVFRQLPAGSVVAPGFTGRYSWTVNRDVTAGFTTDALRVVRSGGESEELRIAMMRGTLKASLRGLVDRQGTLLLGPRDIAYLIDMGDTLPRTYQDVVAVVTVEKSSHGNVCLTQADSTGSTSSSTSSSSSSSPSVTVFDTDIDGIRDEVDLCPGTVLPEPTPSRSLLLGRFALTEPTGSEALPAFRKGPSHTQSEYTIADTRGCSCTQILDAIASPSSTGFSGEAVIERQLKNLFPFYVDTSRKFGCTKAILKIVAGH
ncbi:MAG: hypothetical protein PHZ00_05300 [Candidatus Peribacteraceae bacterium]|nr:hypothetical protein [Candidatus Peribacteraceae bacterium]